jgi:high-affinity iron transporter
MLGALVIVFREVLEAGLIIGIVLAATRGVPRRGWWVALGIAGGVGGACLVAAFAQRLAALFQGSGQELFNALVLTCAVAMLAWHNAWMASHGRELANEARQLGSDVTRGSRSLLAVALVVGIAVLREGSEVVLFLYGILASNAGHPLELVTGGALGLAAGALCTVLVYFGLLAIPIRYFFSVTATLIVLLAAGLAAQAVLFLQQGGYTDAGMAPVWNSGGWLAESSWLGRVLHILVGYTDQPNTLQLVAYATTALGIWALMKWRPARSAQRSRP